MLEQLAYDLIKADAVTQIGLGVALVTGGFVAAALIHREDAIELRRVPYFFLCNALLFLNVIVCLAWFLGGPAIRHDLFWTIILFHLLMLFVFSYASGYLAAGRSRNAYGAGLRSFYDLVPVVGLVLLFKSPRFDDDDRSSETRLLFNTAGLIGGFLLIAASLVLAYEMKQVIESHYARLVADPEIREKFTAHSKRAFEARDVADTLAELARKVPMPVAIDRNTTVTAITADGAALRRTIRVSRAGFTLDSEFRALTRRELCGHHMIENLMQRGATFEDTYVRSDGSLIGVLAASGKDCRR